MDTILNAPPYTKNEYRRVSPQKIRIVHHGAAQENRRLEDFISLISMLDGRYELCYYLLPSQPQYLESLAQFAKQTAPDRVTFLNPVPPRDLVRHLAEFDLGIPILSAVQSTYVNALPNKFFDFIMSGLAIAPRR